MSESVVQLSIGWDYDEEVIVLERLMYSPAGQYILAIKALRESRLERGEDWSLFECKQFVDRVVEKYNWRPNT